MKNNLASLLKDIYPTLEFTTEFLENTLLLCCCEDSDSPPIQSVSIPYNNTAIILPASVRTSVFTPMMDSLTSTLIKCLHKCPSDIRSSLVGNCILTGGLASTPGISLGIKKRLLEYDGMKRLLVSFNFISTPFEKSVLPWVGGSLVGRVGIKSRDEILRVDFEKYGVPDWTNNINAMEM